MAKESSGIDILNYLYGAFQSDMKNVKTKFTDYLNDQKHDAESFDNVAEDLENDAPIFENIQTSLDKLIDIPKDAPPEQTVKMVNELSKEIKDYVEQLKGEDYKDTFAKIGNELQSVTTSYTEQIAPQPAKEEAQIEEPKQEEPQREAPKQEAPQRNEPQPEAPRQEAPQRNEPQPEAPRQEAPKGDVPGYLDAALKSDVKDLQDKFNAAIWSTQEDAKIFDNVASDLERDGRFFESIQSSLENLSNIPKGASPEEYTKQINALTSSIDEYINQAPDSDYKDTFANIGNELKNVTKSFTEQIPSQPAKEEPKMEEPKREEPKREAPQQEAPQRNREEPGMEEPQREAPQRNREEPRMEEPQREAPQRNREEPRMEEPQREAPQRNREEPQKSNDYASHMSAGYGESETTDVHYEPPKSTFNPEYYDHMFSSFAPDDAAPQRQDPRKEEPKMEAPKREEPKRRREEPKREAPKRNIEQPKLDREEPKREAPKRNREEPQKSNDYASHMSAGYGESETTDVHYEPPKSTFNPEYYDHMFSSFAPDDAAPQRQEPKRRRDDANWSSHVGEYFGPEQAEKKAYIKKEGPVGKRFESIGDVARDKLKVFKAKLNGLRAKNSQVYTNMVNALEKVATIGDGADPEVAGKAIDELQKAAETYHKSRKGLFKSKTGRARLNAASDLIDFAKEANTVAKDPNIKDYDSNLKDYDSVLQTYETKFQMSCQDGSSPERLTNYLAELMVVQSHRERVAMGGMDSHDLRMLMRSDEATNRMKEDPVFKSVSNRLSDPAFKDRAANMSSKELMAQMAPQRKQIVEKQKEATKVKEMNKNMNHEKKNEMAGMGMGA